MKTWLWALAALIVGSVIGMGVAVGQLGISPEVTLPQPEPPGQWPSPRASTPKASPETSPKVVVDEEVYDFGTMDSKAEKKHDFVIRNVGKGPLVIENKGTSCKCAISDFKTRTIGPGQSTKVTLSWTAKEYFGPYEQAATIGTNDPLCPKVVLKVKGRITAPLRASPPEVVFSDIVAGQAVRRTVQLFAYESDKLEVTGLRLQDRAMAKFFELSTRELSRDELSQEKDARSGRELEILAKPGLPLGPFRQTILVDTNLPKDAQLEVVIKGKVGGDISILGRDWDEDRQMLRLGVLARGEGADRTLFLRVRGRYRRTIDVELSEVFPPALLSAELGEPVDVNRAVAVRIPLTIHIAKHDGPANYLGSKQSPAAYVLLNTNHPQVPQVKILISFAIEGG